MDGLEIRLAREGDIPDIARIHVRGWQSAYRGIMADDVLDALSVGQREAQWRELLSKAETSNLVAALPENLAAFACLGASRDADANNQEVGEVRSFYTCPSYKRVGIGRRLFDASLELLEKNHFKEATFWVFKANSGARAFYESLGMRYDGTEKLEPGAQESLREMRYRCALPRHATSYSPTTWSCDEDRSIRSS